MTLADQEFPSSQAFDLLSQGLSDPAMKQKFIKQSKILVQFDLKNSAGKTKSWYLDVKKAGEVGEGAAPSKPDVTLILSDKDFGALVNGKASAQKLFLGGKLKVRGNVMKAASLEQVLKAARVEAKL